MDWPRLASTARRNASMSRPPSSRITPASSPSCACASASKLLRRRLAWRLSRTCSRLRRRSSSFSSRARRPSSSRSALPTASSAARTWAFKASAFSTRPRITSMARSNSVRASTSRCMERTSVSRPSVSRRNAVISSFFSVRSWRAREPADSAVAFARCAASVHSRRSVWRAASSESTSPHLATCDCSNWSRPFCSASCVRRVSCCFASRSRWVRTESSSPPSWTSCSCSLRSWSRSD
mmetsp:Transcript_104907/g.321377  ORF Transcript_104907/g.321377 Transcript_104907/m.321377 type:complete len:238 (+) Transcript_104907:386-1099(+)